MVRWTTREIAASAVFTTVGALLLWSAFQVVEFAKLHVLALRLGAAAIAFSGALHPAPVFERVSWASLTRTNAAAPVMSVYLSVVSAVCFVAAIVLWVLHEL